MPERNSHCSYCGHTFVADQSWPRRCASCDEISYRNPLPVAVALLPVDDGLLVVRRDVEPRRGELALPGGFIDHGEAWQAAVVRELYEETGVQADSDDVRLFDVLSAPDGTVLIFGVLPGIKAAAVPDTAPTDETTGWELIHGPAELAFPLHTRVAATYFSNAAVRYARAVAAAR
jgi:ADP-ribose pyrophosphatase YjhB (NUDIX family)